MNAKSTTVAIVLVIAVGTLGYFLGQKTGQEKSAEERQGLKTLVDLSFPPPPQEIYSLSGKVAGIYGATINLEVDDPDDYLPHLDGSLRRKETRFANIMGSTIYTFINYTKLDRAGNPAKTTLSLADIKTGDIITVHSGQNIRDAEKFDVTAIELVKY